MWVPGPNLPTPLVDFCIVSLNDQETEHLLVYGNINRPDDKTWINKYPDNAWTQIPNNIMYPLAYSACARGMIEGKSREVVVVVGYASETSGLTEAFIFDVRRKVW